MFQNNSIKSHDISNEACHERNQLNKATNVNAVQVVSFTERMALIAVHECNNIVIIE